jgi:hypothetical protein
VEQLVLLQGVRDLSLLVDAAEPTQVTQRDFDAAAERVAANGGPPLPEAKRITERLRKSWSEVLTIAHEPPEKHSHLLGAKEKEKSAQDWLTDEYVAHVVRRVANRLGVTTLTPGVYDAERDAMLAEDARQWSHRRPLLLPSADAIITKLGDWDAALLLAGLEVGVRAPQKLGRSRLDVMDDFYDAHGEQPSWRAFLEFARESNVSASAEDGRKWSETVAAWRQRRRDRNLPEPRVVVRPGGRSPQTDPGRNKRPNYRSGTINRSDGTHPHRRDWSERSDCVTQMERYLHSLAPNERSTKRGYRAWARTQDSAPSTSRFDRHGGFESVRRDALKQLAAEVQVP